MRLQDPDYSRVLIVTLAETTPVAEAAELQDDLRRAGIEPFGWVVNASARRLPAPQTPCSRARAALEHAQLARIATLTSRVWALPWSPALQRNGERRRAGRLARRRRIGHRMMHRRDADRMRRLTTCRPPASLMGPPSANAIGPVHRGRRRVG